MSRETLNTYAAEFWESSVKLANESDQSVAQVVNNLGANIKTLHTWINKYSRPRQNGTY